MKKSLVLTIAAIATVLVSLPNSANAQVAFGGTFGGPHGSFSIGVGAPFAPAVGAYVPYPYVDRVYYAPDYGYGFYYGSSWVPCRLYGSRWVIAGSPFAVGRPFIRHYGYRSYYVRPHFYGHRSFRRDRDDRHFRRDRDDRRW
jgi:hypothetical protein